MALLLDVLEIVPRCALGGILLTHVAETSRKFGESLAIGALSEPVDLEVIGLREGWTREETDAGLGVDQNGRSLVWAPKPKRNRRRATDEKRCNRAPSSDDPERPALPPATPPGRDRI